jgi:predicted DNA-binding transcriptional regulator YafY
MEALNLAGIPVISNQGTGGGYEIPDNYRLSRQYLSTSDMKSILAAIRGVNAALDDRELEMVHEKIQALLPVSEGFGPAADDEYIVFDPMGWDRSRRTAGKIQTLYDAARKRKIVSIRYVDSGGKESLRHMEPMTVIQKGFSWYVHGYCLKRKAFRLFKLKRIRQLEVEKSSFCRRPGSYLQSNELHQDTDDMITVVMKFASQLRHVVEEYFDEASVEASSSDCLTVRIDLPYGEWLIGMILAYGDLVEVISPEFLRDEIRTCLEKTLKKYNTVQT